MEARLHMTPDLQEEFRLLSARAEQQLKDVPASESYRHVFSIWTMPSFSPCSRCTVYSPRPFAKGKQPFVSYTIWRSDLDLEKLRTPVERLKYPKDLAPTIQYDVLWLADGELEQIEQRIQAASIPPFLGRSAVVGLDGTRFEFRYDELLFGVSLHWWCDHPREWRPFTEAITRIATELENRRREKTQSGAEPSGVSGTLLDDSGAPPSVR